MSQAVLSSLLRCFAGSALPSTMNTCPTSVNTMTFPKWDLAEQHQHAECQGCSDGARSCSSSPLSLPSAVLVNAWQHESIGVADCYLEVSFSNDLMLLFRCKQQSGITRYQ